MLAVTLCAVMTAMPATALAAGLPADEDLTAAVAQAIQLQEDTILRDSILAEELEELIPGAEEPLTPDGGMEEPAEEAAPTEDTEAPADPNAVQLVFNGQPMELENGARLCQGVTCVPVRDFFQAMGCTVTWDSQNSKICITRDAELTGELQLNSRLARFNGRCWYMSLACVSVDGVAMIPLRDAAKVFSGQVLWEDATQTAQITGGPLLESGETFYDQQDLLWIARIVTHESGNQPLDGKVAVANVILNRMSSAAFPNTAEEVIFDTRSGVQFVTRSSQKIYRAPNQESWLAAKLALEGYETAPDCLYFASNAVSKTCWAGRNRQTYCIIGGHTFFL